MASGSNFGFSQDEYCEAFNLKPGESRLCNSIPELFAFVIGLLGELRNVESKAFERLNLVDRELADRVLTAPFPWWFRGSRADEYALNSGVFRTGKSGFAELKYSTQIRSHADLDRRLQHEYFFLTRRRFEELTSSVWDRLFEMQHCGMPTRLLDWTLNLTTTVFVAVYYARRKKQLHGMPTVWILNPRILSGVFLGEYALNDYAYLELNGTPDELKDWKAVPDLKKKCEHAVGRPNWIYNKLIQTTGHFPLQTSWTNPRLLAQAGCFTLQGGDEASPLDELAREQPRHRPNYLLKVRLNRGSAVDDSALENAWEQLHSIGMDERHLFPERDYIAKSIKERRGLLKQ